MPNGIFHSKLNYILNENKDNADLIIIKFTWNNEKCTKGISREVCQNFITTVFFSGTIPTRTFSTNEVCEPFPPWWLNDWFCWPAASMC